MHDSTSKVQKYTRAHTHTHTHSHTQINTQHSNTQINTHTHTHTYIHTLGSCELESCSRSLHSNRPMQQMPETGLCTVIRPSISSNRLPCSTRSWTSSVDTTHLLQFVEVCRWWLALVAFWKAECRHSSGWLTSMAAVERKQFAWYSQLQLFHSKMSECQWRTGRPRNQVTYTMSSSETSALLLNLFIIQETFYVNSFIPNISIAPL